MKTKQLYTGSPINKDAKPHLIDTNRNAAPACMVLIEAENQEQAHQKLRQWHKDN